jgi:hypothetical protein
MLSRQKVMDIFDEFDIPKWISGKNVTAGWVEIQCPFCADHSHHCGVDPRTELFSCWICHRKGHLIDLLIALTGLSFTQCNDAVSKLSVSFAEVQEEEVKVDIAGTVPVVLPERFELVTGSTNFSLLNDYLKRRNISKDVLISARCGVCRSGEYMNRLVIPVFYQEELVSFQAADLSGFARLGYRSAPLSMGRINDFLYNYDKIKVGGRMIVTEGVLDAWRVGTEAVCSFTSNLTKTQIKLIKEKELNELYFCFDTELASYYKSRELAKEFEAYIPVVEVVKLPYGKDPDEVGREKIYQLIEEIGV